jgi:uncharacterized protein YkwD
MLVHKTATNAVLVATALFVWLGGMGIATPPALSTVPVSSTKQSASSLQAIEQAVFAQINQHRQSRGLSPLTLDERISQQARSHSQAMAQRRRLNHDGFNARLNAIGRSIPFRSGAENVAYNQGFSDPARRAITGWLNSQGHRENIEGAFNLTGIGVARSSRGEYYFTQIFVAPRSR